MSRIKLLFKKLMNICNIPISEKPKTIREIIYLLIVLVYSLLAITIFAFKFLYAYYQLMSPMFQNKPFSFTNIESQFTQLSPQEHKTLYTLISYQLPAN